MKTENFSLPTADSTVTFDTEVRFIRYDEGTGAALPKIRAKSMSGGAFDVELVPGRQIKLPEKVRGVLLLNMSGAAMTGKITLGAGDVTDNSIVGTVALSNTCGAFTQAQEAVTTASAQLLAANAARRYLLIQNKDATGNIWVTLDGAAATTVKGVKVAPGGSYELQGYVPNGAINAIGDIASNTNVVAVEG